jgi:ammonium transporter, Amt family
MSAALPHDAPTPATSTTTTSSPPSLDPAAKRWLILLVLLLGLGFIGAMSPGSQTVEGGEPINAADTAWMLTAAGLVLLMTPGLSFFYGGMVRAKNVISTMLQSFVAMGLVSLLWVIVGFSLAFGDSIGPEGFGLLGDPRTYFMFNGVGAATQPDLSPTIPFVLFAVFQMKFAIITPALVTGSFAERVRFSSYLIFMTLFVLVVYAPLAHWTWHPNGFLRQWGVLDFAGGTVVHMSAGFAALAGAIALGPRRELQGAHEPANIPYVLLGTGMLWFGWFGFNAGSALAANGAAAMAFLTTNTASAAAAVAWLCCDVARGRKPSALGACIGAVVGLVAVTPAAGFINVGASLFIGAIASVISNWAVHFKSSRTQIDDTLDVFPCHGVGGIVGMIATGVFASTAVNAAGADGLLYGGYKLFGMHLLALAIVGAYTFGVSFLLYKLTALISPLRVNEVQEREGLDISQHGERVLA